MFHLNHRDKKVVRKIITNIASIVSIVGRIVMTDTINLYVGIIDEEKMKGGMSVINTEEEGLHRHQIVLLGGEKITPLIVIAITEEQVRMKEECENIIIGTSAKSPLLNKKKRNPLKMSQSSKRHHWSLKVN